MYVVEFRLYGDENVVHVCSPPPSAAAAAATLDSRLYELKRRHSGPSLLHVTVTFYAVLQPSLYHVIYASLIFLFPAVAGF